jgi:hypothetical protein
MKRLGLLLLCSVVSVSVYADSSIAQYKSSHDLTPTLNVGQALPAPVVEFSQFTLDSSADDNLNTTHYSSSGSGVQNLNVTVINKTGNAVYVYVSQAQNIQSIIPCTVVSSNTQYNVSQQCHGDPLPSSGTSYLFLSQSTFNNNASYSSHLGDNFLCNTAGSVTPQGTASPYIVQDSQGNLAITVTGKPTDKSGCTIIKS